MINSMVYFCVSLFFRSEKYVFSVSPISEMILISYLLEQCILNVQSPGDFSTQLPGIVNKRHGKFQV